MNTYERQVAERLQADAARIPLPPREQWLRPSRRQARLLPAFAMIGVLVLAVLIAAPLIDQVRTQNQVASSPSPQLAWAVPAREPADLERLPQEQAVLDAFKAAGIRVTLIGRSHSESQLGRAVPARVFVAAAEQNQGAVGAGADVLFLPAEGTWDIRVCETVSSEPGRLLYEIRVNGARVGGSDAPRRVHHLVGKGVFVIAYAGPSADALRSGLGLSLAPC